MTTKLKNKILSLLTVIIASFIPAILLDKYLEAIFFLICHCLIRPQFNEQYHNIIPKICRNITGCVCFFGITFVLPLSISLMSAIPINYFIGWIGCTKAERDYYKRKCNEYKEKYCNDKEELLRKCRLAKLSERDTLLAQMYFYENKTPKDIWYWLCQQKYYDTLEWDSLYVVLCRIGKKLDKIK